MVLLIAPRIGSKGTVHLSYVKLCRRGTVTETAAQPSVDCFSNTLLLLGDGAGNSVERLGRGRGARAGSTGTTGPLGLSIQSPPSKHHTEPAFQLLSQPWCYWLDFHHHPVHGKEKPQGMVGESV